MNKYGVIYLIKNKINNKMYIGQTVQSFDERYGGNLKKFTHNIHLKNAIDKYGIDNFEIDKEFDVAYSKEELDKLEDMYIKIYQTTDSKFGYNKMFGGSNGLHTNETKKKMRDIQKKINGVKVVCCTNNRVFDTIAEASREYSVSQSEIISCCKDKISKAGYENGVPLQWVYYDDYLLGKKPKDIERIVCVTTEEIFDTLEEAVRKYPSTTISGISQCCSFSYNSCGYDEKGNRLQWIKYTDYNKGIRPKPVGDNRVICITTNLIFENANKASMHYNLDISHLLRNCRLESNYCGKLEDGTRLQWLFYSEYINGKKHFKVKDDRVVCLNYNKVFKNAKEASLFYGLDKSCISKCCRGVRKSCGKDEFGNPMTWMKYTEYKNNKNKTA